MRSKEVDELQVLLRAFEDRHDVGPILAPGVDEKVVSLLTSAPGSENDIEVLRTAATTCWYRFLCLPRSEDAADLLGAVVLFGRLLALGGSMVPEPIRMYIPLLDGAKLENATDPASLIDEIGDFFDLAELMIERIERGCDRQLADMLVDLFDELATSTPPGGPKHADYLDRLSLALLTRFECFDDLGDLDRAIVAGREAVRVSKTHPYRINFLSNLGSTLEARFARTREYGDIDEAVSYCRMAVDLGPRDPAGYLLNLSTALRARYRVHRDSSDIDEAVLVAQRAVREDARPKYVASYGSIRMDRFKETMDGADIDAAVEALQLAASDRTEEDPYRAAYCSDLGNALQLRFEAKGQIGDLNRAIAVGETAVEEAQAKHIRAMYQANLAAAFNLRLAQLGALSDANRAIDACRDALAAFPPGKIDRPAVLSNLGAALHARFRRSGSLPDIYEAISCLEEAVENATDVHGARPRYLSNLSYALRTRYSRMHLPFDLEGAVARGREAVRETVEAGPDKARYLANAAGALAERSELNADKADLVEGIEFLVAAEKMCAAGSSDHAIYTNNLGQGYVTLFRRFGDAEAGRLAAGRFRKAADMPAAPPWVRVSAGRSHGALAVKNRSWREAADGFGRAVEHLGLVTPMHVDRPDQESFLKQYQGLACDAAAAALQSGDPERALTLLEQGRGVMFSQALDLGMERRLRRTHAGLADEMERLRRAANGYDVDPFEIRRLEDPGGPCLGRSILAAVGELRGRKTTIHPTPSENLTETLAKIRDVPGFERFLLPPDIADLLPAAAEGPIVLLNVSEIRSDALILSIVGVSTVPLPALTPSRVRDRALQFLAAIDEVTDGRRIEGEGQIVTILEWLWDSVTGPVLEAALGGEPRPVGKKDAWPRLWWCPSGLLSLLPLHAAGHHETRNDQNPLCVVDRVVSSYTPTVRALLQARRAPSTVDGRAHGHGHGRGHGRGAAADGKVRLVVAMPCTPAASTLGGVAEETLQIRQLFPEQVDVIAGDSLPGQPIPPPTSAATRQAVLDALPRARWAHFACHAASDLANPSASRLLLTDHQESPLTVQDIAGLYLDHVDLAFLSACSTAQGGFDLADEVIHLASAFQLAGYRHVIGTLWPVGEQTALRVAAHVYESLRINGVDDASFAVHRVSRERRNARPDRPSTWASHVHAGP